MLNIEKDPMKRYFNSLANKNVYPFEKIFAIGITGSCGKTSTALYTYYFLKRKKVDVCYIGTHKIYYKDLNIDTKNTTLEISVLSDFLIKNNIYPKMIVMEVSSHGINEARVNCFDFKIIALTNLGLDHLDYHLTKENYHNVKIGFLKSSNAKKIFIPSIYKDKINIKKAYYFDVNNDLFINFNKLKFDFNNLYLSLLILKSLGYEEKDILFELKNINLNNGRGEIIQDRNRKIIIDYAHHIESFQEILNDGNFEKVVVFGCGGNRDKSKRRIMGEIAKKYCKYVIVTKDNSRFESIDEIIKDIKGENKFTIIKERKDAIEYALNCYPNLNVYILGKGDETFIEENGLQIPFNDKEFVLKTISNE